MNEFPLHDLYLKTLSELKAGKRPNLALNKDQLSLCVAFFKELNMRKAPVEDFLPLLALLDHSRKSHFDLQEPLIEAIETRTEPQLLTHCLSSSLKVIIAECEKKGERIPFNFLEALKTPLKNGDPEVIEWTLRVIEQTGHQSILLKNEVTALGKSRWTFFNEHKKNINALIDFLVKRWTPAPNPRK
jgi:hypothetical protein